MDWLFNGLPIHILLVHFVVIVIPLAALCLLLAVAWPAARKRLGIVTPLLALAALISVPLTTEAGETLAEQINETALSEAHADMGKGLLPWAVLLFLVAAAQWAWYFFFAGTGRFAGSVTSRTTRTVITVLLIVAAVIVIVGSLISVFTIGESGAKAVWESRLGQGG